MIEWMGRRNRCTAVALSFGGGCIECGAFGAGVKADVANRVGGSPLCLPIMDRRGDWQIAGDNLRGPPGRLGRIRLFSQQHWRRWP